MCVEAAEEPSGFGSSLAAGWKKDIYAPDIDTGNSPRNPYGSDKATRDVAFTSSCPCVTLRLC